MRGQRCGCLRIDSMQPDAERDQTSAEPCKAGDEPARECACENEQYGGCHSTDVTSEPTLVGAGEILRGRCDRQVDELLLACVRDPVHLARWRDDHVTRPNLIGTTVFQQERAAPSIHNPSLLASSM